MRGTQRPSEPGAAAGKDSPRSADCSILQGEDGDEIRPQPLPKGTRKMREHSEDFKGFRNLLYCGARPPFGVQAAYPHLRSTALLGSEGCRKDGARLHSGCRRVVA